MILRFLWYFHLFESYDTNFFTDTFFDVRRVFQVPSKCVENDFSQFWSLRKRKKSAWKSRQNWFWSISKDLNFCHFLRNFSFQATPELWKLIFNTSVFLDLFTGRFSPVLEFDFFGKLIPWKSIGNAKGLGCWYWIISKIFFEI